MGKRLAAGAALGSLFAIASSSGIAPALRGGACVARARDLDADPSNLVQMIDALAGRTCTT